MSIDEVDILANRILTQVKSLIENIEHTPLCNLNALFSAIDEKYIELNQTIQNLTHLSLTIRKESQPIWVE